MADQRIFVMKIPDEGKGNEGDLQNLLDDGWEVQIMTTHGRPKQTLSIVLLEKEDESESDDDEDDDEIPSGSYGEEAT